MTSEAALKPLTQQALKRACGHLAEIDAIFGRVYRSYGVPPLWDREPGFVTLLNIILEQQVSLASAKACFDKLSVYLGLVTPEAFLKLNDRELKTVGFSRQKTTYARHLSEAIIAGHIDIDGLHRLDDAAVKVELIKLKGVGEWTSDIYLLMALLRPDIMPRGDIALHEAYKRLTGGDKRPDSDEFIEIAKKWTPHRSTAARLLWHWYLCEKRPPSAKARA